MFLDAAEGEILTLNNRNKYRKYVKQEYYEINRTNWSLVNMAIDKVIETDVLVVGGGQAGLFAAIKAKEQGVDVTLVDKGYAGKSGQSQNPCVMDVFVPERHNLKDWVYSGHVVNEYMDNLEWVEIVFKESQARWQDLCSYGLKSYKWDKNGKVFVSPAAMMTANKFPANTWDQPVRAELYRPWYSEGFPCGSRTTCGSMASRSALSTWIESRSPT